MTARFRTSRDLIVITPAGKVDLENSEAAIRALAQEVDHASGKAVIFDLRSADCTLSVADLYAVAGALSKGARRAPPGKVAVLLDRQASPRKAEFFALCAGNRGFEARAFNTIEPISQWLGVDASGALAAPA